jgi:chromosome partitioning protein
MDCVAVINQKGGVGKTTTTVNIGAALAQHGKRVLLIDLDPQGHLTTHLGLDTLAQGRGTYEVLTKDLPLSEAIHAISPNISVLPAQIDLAAAEVELVSVVGREVILRDHLASLSDYDLAVIDCPPSLGVLTLNALAAASHVLIPLQPHFLALQGVGKLFETIRLVAGRINPGLRVAGMVMCMYEAGTRLAGEVIDDLQAYIEGSRGGSTPWRDALIFQTRIRRNVKLAECPSYGKSIFDYAPNCHGAADYLQLADELISVLSGVPRSAPTTPLPTSMPVVDRTSQTSAPRAAAAGKGKQPAAGPSA